MAQLSHLLGVYLHLVQASQRRQRPHARDRLLVIAAALASEGGLARVADYCRWLVLEHNAGHMLRRWPTVGEALEDEEFHIFLKQLHRRYPTEKAERMLESLGIELASEREAYYSDEEYAAALLGIDLGVLDRMFGKE